MIQYQSTPDYYRDYIEHGWLKDQAAKAHKYIDRWRGKNGKWYYRYKSKAEELGTKSVRNVLYGYGSKDPSRISYNRGSDAVPRSDSGKANSLSGQTGSKSIKTTKVSSKVSRKPKKNENLTSRGYSGSQGSGESKRQRNLGTRRRYDVRESANTHHDSYGRLASAYYRTNNKKTKSQIRDSWEKNKKKAKINALYARGAEWNGISEWEADRMLTDRGYPSASSWEGDVKKYNKATNKSVNRKRNTSANNRRYVRKNSVAITKNGKRTTRSRDKKTKYVK